MKTLLRAAAASVAILAGAALPVASQAASTTTAQPQQYQFETRLADQFHAGEYDGNLSLTISPNGIVQGFYRPSDGGIRTVSGGLDGQNIWLEIGMQHPLRVTGTFKDGVLRTVAQIPGPDHYVFESVAPQKG